MKQDKIETKSILRPEVAEKFEVRKGLLSVFASADFGHVDLTTINLEFASRLADAGYLIKKSV